MKNFRELNFLFFLVTLLITGCAQVDDDIPGAGSDGACGPATGTTTYSFSTDIQPIFDSNCMSCHGAGAEGGLSLSAGSSYCNLYKVTSSGYSPSLRVDPENSTGSVLYGKVSGTGGWGAQMPYGNPALSDSDISIIKTWIDEGAINN